MQLIAQNARLIVVILSHNQNKIIMKKIALVSIAVLFLSVAANAQLLQFGVKAGINFSTLQMDDITGIDDGSQVYDLVTGESVTGYQAGLMARVNVAMFFVQPELYFNTTGGVVEQVVEGGANELLNVKFNRLDIPLLVGLKLGPARINAGPVGSAMISSVNELKGISQDLETLTGGLTWGFQAGVGLDLFKKLAIDLRYEGSLSQYGDSFNVGGSDYALDARPTQVIFTLGYWF